MSLLMLLSWCLLISSLFSLLCLFVGYVVNLVIGFLPKDILVRNPDFVVRFLKDKIHSGDPRYFRMMFTDFLVAVEAETPFKVVTFLRLWLPVISLTSALLMFVAVRFQ